MADIYLVYAREDRERVRSLYTQLSKNWDVWWDQRIKERFASEVEAELLQARCVLVMWSSVSRLKDTVTDEVRIAQKHKVPIVTIRLDNCDPAYGFGGYSCTDLSGWTGDAQYEGFRSLLSRLEAIIPQRRPPARPDTIAKGRLPLPTLFLSVSSYETRLIPHDAVKALSIFGVRAILISAWDLVARRKPKQLIEAVTEYRAQGGFVLVDSGNYEASRLSGKRWRPYDLREALACIPHDWAFCFDVMDVRRKPERAAQQIIEAVHRDQELTEAPVLPIVHAPKLRNGKYKTDNLPEVVFSVAQKLQPQIIAIPERELGAGLIARTITMRGIRRQLDKLPFYQPVHLLGTGDPWSIAILTAAGADTFDGLEWCRVVADMENDRLHHFQHYDFFTYQTGVAESHIARAALQDPQVDYAGKAAFHNIDYFTRFNEELHKAVASGRLEAFIAGRMGKGAAEQLNRQVLGLFR